MKRTVACLVATGVIMSSAPSLLEANVVQAASSIKTTLKAPAVMKIHTQKINLDGIQKDLHFIKVNNKTIYSAKDMGAFLKAKFFYDKKAKTYKFTLNGKTVSFNLNQNYVLSNNKKITLQAPVTLSNKEIYLDLNPVMIGLGADVLVNDKEVFIASKGLISGNNSNVKWIDQQHVLVTNELDEETSQLLLVNTQSKKIVKSFQMADVVLSPNGSQAIFTDENDALYVLDVKTQTAKLLSTDDSFKAEFTWSADSSKVYFLQGEKNEIIAQLNMVDGVITKVLDDKVEYKTDLRVSKDGSKFYYNVAKQAETKYNSDKSDVDTIVTEGTEPQVFLFDKAANKSVALTNSKENKYFSSILSDGKVLFLGVDSEDESKTPILKMISADGKSITHVVTEKQIDAVNVTASGKVYVLITEKDDTSSLYTLNVDSGSLTKVLNTKQTITEMSISQDEKSLAVTIAGDNGSQIALVKNGKLEFLTK